MLWLKVFHIQYCLTSMGFELYVNYCSSVELQIKLNLYSSTVPGRPERQLQEINTKSNPRLFFYITPLVLLCLQFYWFKTWHIFDADNNYILKYIKLPPTWAFFWSVLLWPQRHLALAEHFKHCTTCRSMRPTSTRAPQFKCTLFFSISL